MLKTPNMGLWGWDLEKDKFSHEQLVSNFRAIDDHNHSPGRGAQLSGESLFDGAIEHKQIAKEAVDGTNVKEHSLGSEQIESGFLPLGCIIAWYRQTGAAVEPGPNWCLCDGRPWASVTNTLGYTSGNVPDLRGKFIMGAAGFEIIGSTGGAAGINLSHSHTVNAHTHTIGGHTHTIGGHTHTVQGHAHGIANHTHGINPDGEHFHIFGEPLVKTNLNQTFIHYQLGTSFVELLRIPNISVAGSTEEPMSINGLHNHSGATLLGGSGGTEASVPFSSSENSPFESSANSNFASGPTATSTDSQLGTVSILPPYVELAYIIKIK